MALRLSAPYLITADAAPSPRDHTLPVWELEETVHAGRQYLVRNSQRPVVGYPKPKGVNLPLLALGAHV